MFHLPEIGCTSEHWWQAVRTGRWHLLSERVLAPRGSPATEAQRVLAGVLDAGPMAFLHHPSALAWLGLEAFDLRAIEVARARANDARQPTLARLHRLRYLRPQDVIVVRGVPTESALRALFCEAARYATPALADIGFKKVGRLLDEANRLKLATWAGLHEMVDDLQQRGRAGTVIMRALAEERQPGTSPTDSRNESQLEEVLDRAGARSLRRQVLVGGEQLIGRVDHRDDQLPLVVEVNSELFHTNPTDRAADEVRYQRLIDAGFTVCVVWERDLWRRARGVTDAVATARRHASVGDRVVIHSPGCPWPLPHVGAPRADRSG